jgi:VanZ family protein
MDWLRHWGPAIFFMAVIFLCSAMPGTEVPEFGGWDLLAKKGGHMLGYALLASANYYALTKGKSPARLHSILALCMAVLYAFSDEFHQRFVPGRSPSLFDVGIDTIGALIGVTLFVFVRKIQSVQQSDAKAASK